MSDPVECLRHIVKSDDKLELLNYLNCCKESRIFSQQNDVMPSLISNTNTFMNDRTKRIYGLIILEKLLDQCPKSLISSNLAFWMDQCVKGSFQQDDESVMTLSISLLYELLTVSIEFPDVKKQINLTLLPKILDSFFKHGTLKQGNKFEKLKCLEIILKKYAKSCVKWKENIHQFIFEHLESSDSEVYHAGMCYLYLALAGPPSIDSIKYTETWQQQTYFIISALHSRLNILFENINEIQGSYNKYLVKVDLKDISNIESEKSLFAKMQRLTSQFKNLAEFLYILCRAKIPCQTPIQVDAILSVICRAVAINGSTLKANVSADSINLLTQIPVIHRACVRIAEALILSLNFDVFRYTIIPKALLQTLSWTQSQDWPIGHQKPYSKLRISAYKCLSLWMSTTHSIYSRPDVIQYIEDIITNITSDISYKRETVALNVEIGKLRRRARKARATLSTKVKTPFLEDHLANSNICHAALEMIQPFMEAAKYDINEEHFMKLVGVVIELLSSISCSAKGDRIYPIPYADDNCRLELYRSLLVMTLYNKPQFPSPVLYANKLFQEGYHDTSPEVSKFCAFAVLSVSNILYPSVPLEGFIKQADKLQNYIQQFKIDKNRVTRYVCIEPERDLDNSNQNESSLNETSNILEYEEEIVLNEPVKTPQTRSPVPHDHDDDDDANINIEDRIEPNVSNLTEDVTPSNNEDITIVKEIINLTGERLNAHAAEKRASEDREDQNTKKVKFQLVEQSIEDESQSGNDVITKETEIIETAVPTPETQAELDVLESEMLNSFVDVI